MIEKKNRCPFRKEYKRTDYNTYGSGFPGFDYKEEFQECIGEECMAYGFMIMSESITEDGEKHTEKLEWCRLMS